jgi:hypothetical protein
MLTLDYQPRATVAVAGLPTDLVLSEHAVQRLRAYLDHAGLGEYRIYHIQTRELYGIDNVLDRLDPDATWEAAEESLAMREAITPVTFSDDGPISHRAWHAGYLHVRAQQVIIARWYWAHSDGPVSAFYLIAAPQPACVSVFRKRLIELSRTADEPFWHIAGDYGLKDRMPRSTEDVARLVLDEPLRQRVETEVIGFFTPRVARLYERLGVPQRRGVLLYGEPGNGKTSLIRAIGARLPEVSCILLRAGAEFDTDSLTEILSVWQQHAPAILVIEDLSYVLERINVSTFLNLLDGVDRRSRGALMLIASTNHPDQLDPALSNRPGRFDVTIELPCPGEPARREYFRSRLLEIDLPTIDRLVEDSRGFSFAHLEEIVRLSGLIAVRGLREARTSEDVLSALSMTRDAFNAARHGFAKKPEAPFGLRPRG